MNEDDLNVLVERHRESVPMSIPPPGLLDAARRERTHRRRRTTGLALLTAGAAGVVLLGAHALSTVTSRDDARPPGRQGGQVFRITHTLLSPPSRMVGLNGWALQVPGRWGTDRVGCDGRTAVRASVTFDHRQPRPRPCVVHSHAPFVHISDRTLTHGVPWRTVSGVQVEEQLPPASSCRTCLTLGVPSAHVTFAIHARTPTQLQHIEQSLRPLSDRQITVPIWRGGPGQRPIGEMTRISLAEGLRPQVHEVPNRSAPGTFLYSYPPIGTPVDLGRGVSLVYSAGDLGAVASARSLHLHGWRASAATDFAPPVGRDTALRTTHQSLLEGRAYLRRLTITHEGPRTVRFRNRLAWLVVTSRGAVTHDFHSSITALDASTGRVLEARDDFSGRSR